jgi:hypothetical protein
VKPLCWMENPVVKYEMRCVEEDQGVRLSIRISLSNYDTSKILSENT